MVEIDDKLISTEIFERKFVCDLTACKGACCVEGDNGAPLTLEEVDILEEIYDAVKPFMREEGIAAVEKTGVFYMDEWNEPATTLVDNQECAFVYFDEKGITKCAIEQAHLAGKVDWKKPISCHLYPIRVSKLTNNVALNYDEWNICKPACACGEQLNVPVYKFLKEPIIRAFGEEFYDDMEKVDALLKENPPA
ncbi:MAG: DUF3109 family protein [Fluviicola sp.]|nr:DUF3109 family protein [Fluviicola sp.]